jgi:hypothetical protein
MNLCGSEDLNGAVTANSKGHYERAKMEGY